MRKLRAKREAEAGETIEVLHSWNADVAPGTAGIVVKRMLQGYEVEITTVFSDAFGRRSLETRHMYFHRREIRVSPR